MPLEVPFRRCFYDFSRELFRRPTRSRHFHLLYGLDVASVAYATPRMTFLVAVLRGGDPALREHLRRRDPSLNFFLQVDAANAAFVLVVALLHLFMATALVVRIDREAPVWRFWADVTVRLQEAYFRARLGPTELAEARKRTAQELMGKLVEGWLVLPAMISSSSQVLNWTLTEVAAPLATWATLQDLDRKRFYAETKPYGLPTLDSGCKRRAALYMAVIDRLTCLVMNAIGR